MILGSARKRSEFNKTPPTPGIQEPAKSKVYYFENLEGPYIRVTSPKYKCSFEFSSSLKYFPPLGERQKGMVENIGFLTEKRMKNDISAIFVINFSPIEDPQQTMWNSFKLNPNAIPYNLGGLEAVKIATPKETTVYTHNEGITYWFSYRPEYTPKNAGPISEEELAEERENFEYMLKTFKALK